MVHLLLSLGIISLMFFIGGCCVHDARLSMGIILEIILLVVAFHRKVD